MTVNTNCLEGMRCPSCGQNNCFMVDAIWHGQVHVYEDGTDEMSGGHTEWKDEFPAACVECPWTGKVEDLYWMNKLPPVLRSRLVTMLEYSQLTRKLLPSQALYRMDLSDESFEEVLEFFDDVLTEIGE